MKSVRLTEDAILTIFDKLGNAIGSLTEKLNRKWVCIKDNRVILGSKLLDIHQFAHS